MCLADRRGRAHLLAIVLGSLLLALPMHASTALVIHVHAIGANIAFARLKVFRDHRGQRNEPSAAKVWRFPYSGSASLCSASGWLSEGWALAPKSRTPPAG